jgi:tetratricopeptide (TPR) repeat protein/curved DNA-binding protein CbpA
MNTLYDLLGVRPDADDETLKRAFRKAAKTTHPDLGAGDPDALLRFRQIVIARDILRDAKQRAVYNRLLEWERQRLRSKWKRMVIFDAIAIAVIAVAMVEGYRLFVPIPTTAVAAVKQDDDTSIAVAAVKTDGVKGDIDNAGKPVETTGAQVIEPTDAPDQGQQRDKHDGTEVPDEANKLSADKHEDAKVLNEANKPSDDAGAIMRLVMQRLRDGGDAQAAAGRELALGPPSAGKHEDAKVPNEAHELSDDAAAIMRFVMQRLRDGLDAQATAGRELALGPPAADASFYRERGIAAYGSGDFLGAIGNFDEAIRLNPNDAQSYNIRGNVWDELGILERALADYDEAIRIDPNNPAVFHDRAILWQREGELDKALVDLDRAIRFSFFDVNMYCDRGLVWYQKGRHDRAVADFDRAIKLDPNSAAACIKRGLIVHRNSKFKLAFATVNQAIRVDPSIFDALLGANLHP